MSAPRSVALAVLTLAALGLGAPAGAQTVGRPPDKPAAATKAEEAKASQGAEALKTGTKAFESGKTDAAVAALSTAITSGGLKNPDLAKALFYRGVALRRQQKPGAALSDLNAAVWLRDGLSAADKSVAEDHRQALLREIAALRGGTPAETAPAATPAAPVEPAAPAAPDTPIWPPVQTAAATEPSASPVPEPVKTAAPDPAAAEPAPMDAPIPADGEALPWRQAEPATAAPVPVVAAADGAGSAPAQVRDETPAPRAVAAAEQPLPWTTAAAEDATRGSAAAAAPADRDMIAEPIAAVAPIERTDVSTVEAEPAAPEAPLPWMIAEAAPARAGAETPAPVAEGGVGTATAPPAAPEPAPPASVPPPQPQPVAFAPPSHVPAAPEAAGTMNIATSAPAEIANAGKAAGTFLSQLFTGSSAATPSQAAPAETAAIRATEPEVPVGAAPVPAAWPAETQRVAPDETARTEIASPMPVAVAGAAPEPAPAAPAVQMAVPMPGPYRLQIAAENSRADAEKTLARLVSQHGLSLNGREPVIEEPQTGSILFGSMGAAYRVSVGPYATSAEPGRLCNILQPRGFDCRVVAVAP